MFPPQPDQLGARFSRGVAHFGAHFHHGLVHLGFDRLAQHHLPIFQELGDVRFQLPGLRVDDLVLLFDSDAE